MLLLLQRLLLVFNHPIQFQWRSILVYDNYWEFCYLITLKNKERIISILEMGLL